MVRQVLRRTVIAGGLLIAVSVPVERAAAQSAGGSRVTVDSVPKEFLPPADMCRIWLDGVPATQQPAPTECSLAVRNKPPNGKVIYGPKKAGASGKGLTDVPIKRFDNKATPKPPLKIPGRPDVSDAGRAPLEAKRVTDEPLYGDQQGNLPNSVAAR